MHWEESGVKRRPAFAKRIPYVKLNVLLVLVLDCPRLASYFLVSLLRSRLPIRCFSSAGYVRHLLRTIDVGVEVAILPPPTFYYLS